MLVTGIVILVIIGAAILFINGASFGSLPSLADLKKIQRLPYFRDGQIQNLTPTPTLTGAGFFNVLKEFLFGKSKQSIPPAPLPSRKTDLLRLDRNKNILVWFGHSSYFMQIDGKRILVDPVFSGNASPLRFMTKSFKGSDIYTVSDIPDIDYLFITHDHWDHLDYRTILQLKTKVKKKIITALGVGAHLVFWDFDKKNVEEMEWDDQINPEEGFSVSAVTARHFSGRGLQGNKSLWTSFILTTTDKKIFIGGDSGYGNHFADIGKRFGPFDLAILEDGQYNKNWKYIHMMPEETVQAAIDLGAKKLLPVHWAKFSLSLHAWDEPIIRIKKEAELKNVYLLHPMIGECVDLDAHQIFTAWWERIQ